MMEIDIEEIKQKIEVLESKILRDRLAIDTGSSKRRCFKCGTYFKIYESFVEGYTTICKCPNKDCNEQNYVG